MSKISEELDEKLKRHYNDMYFVWYYSQEFHTGIAYLEDEDEEK